jgi:regulator of protease activity HflC (stomatin/prohibitin superfamily)
MSETPLHQVKPVGPFITYAVGFVLSSIVGIAAGCIGNLFFSFFSGLPTSESYPGFWVLGCPVGALFFYSGLGHTIQTGWLGVPRWLKKRIDRVALIGSRSFFLWDNILSEGSHWMPPWMDAIPVNHQIQTSEPIPVTGYSAGPNPLKMRAVMLYNYVITRPFKWLDAKDNLRSLEVLGQTEYRNAFARHTPDELIKDEVSSPIAKEVELSLQNVSESDYGIGVIKVLDPHIQLPEDVDEALELERKAQAEVDAERVRTTAFNARVQDLKNAGLKPDVAAETVLIERGHMSGNRNLQRIEGYQGIVEAIRDAAVQVVQLFKERNAA